jgi:branched-chain amino acid aminotransferase
MAAIPETEFAWKNGRFIKWHEATIHALSHVASYGSAVFEGIRCYSTPTGPAIFRLREHIRRLFDSAKIYRMEITQTPEEVEQACAALVARNRLGACYVRPSAMRGYGSLGVDPAGAPIDLFIFAYPWGPYLGPEALAQGVDVMVSTWARPAPNTFPSMAKASGNYLNSQLIRMEARANGYIEGIALDVDGRVSEGSGENLFLVRDGRLWTSPLSASILPGITRDTVVTLAREMSIPVVEAQIPREALYIADELFFCGTAVEVTPIRSVDRITIGNGKPGPITRRLQDAYLATTGGKEPDTRGWLCMVGED